MKEGKDIAVLSLGTISKNVTDALIMIPNNDIAHYDMRFVKPLDEKLLHKIMNTFKTIVTIEDGTKTGGFGSAILEFASKHSYNITIEILGIPDEFIEQGTTQELQKIVGLDSESISIKLNSLIH